MAPEAEETVPDQQEQEEKGHEEPREETREKGEKKDPPSMTSLNADRKDETRQKSHPERYASDEQ